MPFSLLNPFRPAFQPFFSTIILTNLHPQFVAYPSYLVFTYSGAHSDITPRIYATLPVAALITFDPSFRIAATRRFVSCSPSTDDPRLRSSYKPQPV